MTERSVLGTVLGIPPLAAVGTALVFTAIGVLIDILRIGTLGLIFTICYFTGAVLAVAWVRRRSLFGPVVQPPLLIAVVVPVVVWLVGTPGPGTGITERLLLVGAPMINAFPMMATTTATVAAVAVTRVLLQRIDSSRAGRPWQATGADARRPARGGRSRPAREAGPDAAVPSGAATRGTTTGRSRAARALDDLHAAEDAPSGTTVRRGSSGVRGAGRTSRSPRRY
ncbi:hypothetical protein PA7_23760 [Pseudonocardia asaccharolytica DSM 44247 = NBRC 16224]|uniref:DUF6542 domain-containing protein n=2 Tax=Pseudonocardia asaccharolytica TaxID=54010 RepID=A0A511D166_9PSEU|nr:hypothetical protein PA7_23760 [Pseudonocardia asaccharolytica DSM 44247 = NBRC 16224]